MTSPPQNRVYPDQVTNKRPTQPYYCTTYTVGFTSAYSIHQTQLTIINWGYSLHCSQYYLLTLYLQAHRRTAGRGREGQNTLQSAGFRTPHLPSFFFFSFFRARGMWYSPHSEYALGMYREREYRQTRVLLIVETLSWLFSIHWKCPSKWLETNTEKSV